MDRLRKLIFSAWSSRSAGRPTPADGAPSTSAVDDESLELSRTANSIGREGVVEARKQTHLAGQSVRLARWQVGLGIGGLAVAVVAAIAAVAAVWSPRAGSSIDQRDAGPASPTSDWGSSVAGPQGEPVGDPDLEVSAFIDRLAVENPHSLLAHAKERRSFEGDLPHLYEMTGIAELELGFLNDAMVSFEAAAPHRPSAACYLGYVHLQLHGATDDAISMLGEPEKPDRRATTICLKAQVELAALRAVPLAELLPIVLDATDDFRDDVDLAQLAALMAVGAGDPRAADLAERAWRLQPESIAANLTRTQVAIATATDEHDSMAVAQVIEDLEAMVERAVVGSRTYDRAAVTLALALAGVDNDSARTILAEVVEGSLVPLQRQEAAAQLVVLEHGAYVQRDEVAVSPPAELTYLGDQLLGGGFGPIFVAAGYRAYVVARLLEGRVIDAYTLEQRALTVLDRGSDPFGGSTATTGLPAGVAYGAVDPCGHRPAVDCEMVDAAAALDEHSLWRSADQGDLYLELGPDGRIVGSYADDGYLAGEVVDGRVRGRWCESPEFFLDPGAAGPVEFSFVLVDGRYEMDGRWLSEGHIDSASWEENWDAVPLVGRSDPAALASLVGSREGVCE